MGFKLREYANNNEKKQNTETPSASAGGFSLRDYANGKQQERTVSSATSETPQPMVNLEPNQYTTRAGYTDTASSNYSREDILRMLADAKVAQEQEQQRQKQYGNTAAKVENAYTLPEAPIGTPTIGAEGIIKAAEAAAAERKNKLRADLGYRDESGVYSASNAAADYAKISKATGISEDELRTYAKANDMGAQRQAYTALILNGDMSLDEFKNVSRQYNVSDEDAEGLYAYYGIEGLRQKIREAADNPYKMQGQYEIARYVEKQLKDRGYTAYGYKTGKYIMPAEYAEVILRETNAPEGGYTAENLAEYPARALALCAVDVTKNPAWEKEADQIYDILYNNLFSKNDEWRTGGDIWTTVANNIRETARPTAVGIMLGLAKGLGSESIAKLISEDVNEKFDTSYARVSQLAPTATNISNTVGTIGLYTALAYLTGGVASSVAGAGASVVGASAASTGVKLATAGLTGAMTFGSVTALQNLGDYARGNINIAEYGKRIGQSEVVGAATSLASGLVRIKFDKALTGRLQKAIYSNAGENFTTKIPQNAYEIMFGGDRMPLVGSVKNPQTVFYYFTRNMASGLAGSGAFIASNALVTGQAPTPEQVAYQFAFGFVSSLVHSFIEAHSVSAAQAKYARNIEEQIGRIDAEMQRFYKYVEGEASTRPVSSDGEVSAGGNLGMPNASDLIVEIESLRRYLVASVDASSPNAVNELAVVDYYLAGLQETLAKYVVDPSTGAPMGDYAAPEQTNAIPIGIEAAGNYATTEEISNVITSALDAGITEGAITPADIVRAESVSTPVIAPVGETLAPAPAQISPDNTIEQNLAALAQTPVTAETSEISAVSPAENTSEGNFTSEEINARNAQITPPAPAVDKRAEWSNMAVDYGEQGREAFDNAFDETLEGAELAAVADDFRRFYNEGRNSSDGALSDDFILAAEETRLPARQILGENEATELEAAAFAAGVQDARNALTVAAESGIISSNDIEGGNNNGRQESGVRVRGRSLRGGVQSTGEQTQAVRGEQAQDQSGRARNRGQERVGQGTRRGFGLSFEARGQKVSGIELGLRSGTEKADVTVDTKADPYALRKAAQHGYRYIQVKGNIEVSDGGETFRVNGVKYRYNGQTIIAVNADDPRFTPKQLWLHEQTHAEIADGRADIKKLANAVFDIAGSEENVKELIRAYRDKYAGVMTTEKWIEELICDSKAAMDRFGVEGAKKAMDSIRRAAGKVYEASRSAEVDVAVAEGKAISLEDELNYSPAHDAEYMEAATDNPANTAMTMAEARRMIETAYRVGEIKEWYADEGTNQTVDEWLKNVGSDDIAMIIENDFDLQRKYINSNTAILDDEYQIEDVIDAYKAGTLVGKEKKKAQRLDVKKETGLKDDRFYAPREIENAKERFELAQQRITNANKQQVIQARADIVIFAHNRNAAELLGISQAELNKKLRSWTRYSASAREISERINAGVPLENRWTGIENSSFVNRASISQKDIDMLVKSVTGDPTGAERKYIARVMLALDTHINYKGLNFIFESKAELNKKHGFSGRTNGVYNGYDTIACMYMAPNTVAHEMGHYLDTRFARDLVGGREDSRHYLTRGVNKDIVRERYGEDGVRFVDNFNVFMDGLTDVNDTYSSYSNDRAEVFARFVARFVEWTENVAAGYRMSNYEYNSYNDHFTTAQYVEFARLLQEKAMLDGVRAKETGVVNAGAGVPTDGSAEKYDIGILENGNTYVVASRRVITASDVPTMRRQITDFFQTLIGDDKGIKIPTIEGDVLTITKAQTGSKARDNYITVDGKRVKMADNEFAVKVRAEAHIDELAETSEKRNTKADEKEHSFAPDGFVYRTAFFQDFDGKYYKITLSVGNNGEAATVYNIGKIKEDKLPSAKLIAVVGSKPLGNMSSVDYDTLLPTKSQEEISPSQKISSAKTSIKQVPALFNNPNVEFGETNVDIGGGRFDLATQQLEENGTRNYVFDPFNRSDASNRATLNFIKESGGADTVTCANVLNVIAEPEARANVILEAAKAIKPDGTAYFMVYEGDGKGEGRETSAGWQNNRTTASYVSEIERYFGDVQRKGKLIIASDPQTNGERAYWQFDENADNGERFSGTDSANGDAAQMLSDLRRQLREADAKLAAARGQLKRTEQPTVRSDDARRISRDVIKRYGSSASVDGISKAVEDLGNLIVRGGDEQGDATFTRVKEAATDIMYNIIAMSDDVYDADTVEVQKQIRSRLQSAKFYVSQYEKGDLSLDYESYDDFRRRNFGNVKTTSDPKAMHIDTFYDEICGQFPWMLDTGLTSQAEQLKELIRVSEMPLKPTYNIAEEAEVESLDLLDRIMSAELRQVETFADRAQKKLDQAVVHERLKQSALKEKIAALKEDIEREKAKRREELKVKRAVIEEERKRFREYKQTQAEKRRAREASDRLLKMVKRVNRMDLNTPNRAWFEQHFGDIYTLAKTLTGNKIISMENLEKRYAHLKETDQDFIGSDRIENQFAEFRNKQRDIASMTEDEIAAYTTTLLMFEKQVRDGNRMTRIADRTNVRMMAYNVISDVNATKGVKPYGVVAKVENALITSTLDAVRSIRRYTGYNDGDPLYQRTLDLAQGQEETNLYVTRARAKFANLLADKKFTKWFTGPNAEEIKVSVRDALTGEETELKLTPALRTALYLNNQNDDNRRHITYGGVVIPDIKLLKKGDFSNAYAQGKTVRLTPTEISKITRDMTSEEKNFARVTNSYFSGMSAPEIERVYEELFGVPPKMVGAGYYPLKVVKGWMRNGTDETFDISADTTAGAFDIGSPGWLKERVTSEAPIYLFPVDRTVNTSIEQHGKYVGLAIPYNNFNKLWNAALYKKTERFDPLTQQTNRAYAPNIEVGTVRQNIEAKWGAKAGETIQQFLDQISGKEKTGATGIFGRLRSNYAGAVLELNPSTALKQAPSGLAAAAVVGWQPLMKALNPALKADTSFIDKMTAAYLIRKAGYSSQELGELADRGKKLPAALSWIIGADLATTSMLKRAAAFYVRDNTDLAVGSDEYKRAVVDIYQQIISETQPTYDVLYRSKVLRSKNQIVRALNMFKTQPFKNFNILYDSLGNLQAKRRSYYEANRWANDTEESKRYAEEAKKAYHDAKKKVVWAFTSQAASGLMISLIMAGWDILRGRDKKYRDDEGEMSFWSFLKGLGINFASTGAGMIPGGGVILEGVETLVDTFAKDDVFGTTAYGFSVPEVDLLNDTVSGITKLTKTLYNEVTAEDGADWESIGRAIYSSVEQFSQFAGIPLANARKTLEVMARQIFKSQGYFGDYLALRIAGTPDTNKAAYYDLLYKAYGDDKTEYDKLYKQLVSDGYSESAIKSAMEDRMKKAQGVDHVDDLSHRYLNPTQQREYDSVTSKVRRSEVWSRSDGTTKAKLEDIAYDVIAGYKRNTWQTESITTDNNLTQTEYILYKLALDVVDKPNSNGKYGTYTDAEKEKAVKMAKKG